MREFRDKSSGGEIQAGSCVAFRIGDAVCPETEQAIAQIGSDVRICGEVVFFSDSGGESNHFAIISADGIDTPIIVPVSKLAAVAGSILQDRLSERPGRRNGDTALQRGSLARKARQGEAG